MRKRVLVQLLFWDSSGVVTILKVAVEMKERFEKTGQENFKTKAVWTFWIIVYEWLYSVFLYNENTWLLL